MKLKKIKILIIGQNSYVGNSFESYMINYKNYCVDKISVRDDIWYKKSFKNYDAVFYVAGIAHSDNGKISEEKAKLYYKINTDLTIKVAEKAKKDGVKQFIFMSSIIVYGASARIGEKKVITTKTLPSPINAYGDSKLRAEMGLAKLKDNKFKVAIIRSPMVYGEGCKGNFKTLEKFAKVLPIFPYIENERSVIHIERLCIFIKYLIDKNLEGIFLPQDDEYMNTSEMVRNIALKNGKKIKFVKGFGGLLKVLSKITPYVDKAFGNFVYKKEFIC